MFKFDVPSAVIEAIRHCQRTDLVDKLVGLSLCPKYQSNHLRIITLIHVALVHACGKTRVSRSALTAMLNGLRTHESGQNEDPAEDVFVSTVSTPQGQYRIFNGIYPAADFSLQRLLDAVFSQDFAKREQLSAQCKALLVLSEALADRCGLQANTFEPSEQWRTRWPIAQFRILELGRAAHFSPSDLCALGIERKVLDPFCLDSLEGLVDVPFGCSALVRRPLLVEDDGISLPLASAISPALRLHLAHAIANGVAPKAAIETFHSTLMARWLLLDLPVRKIRPLLVSELSLPEIEVGVSASNQAVLRFDEDKLAHLLVLEADWSAPPEQSIHETRDASQTSQQIVTKYIRQSAIALQKSQNVNRGLTLIVYDSPGWNVNYQFPANLDTNWLCVGLSAYSLATLLADPGFNLLDLWKMLRERQAIEAIGIRVLIWPDMLVYWSVWQAFGGTFWPKTIDLRAFGGLAPDTSKVIDIVSQIRQNRNLHAALLPYGEWRRVERWYDENAPSGDYVKPIFSDATSFMLQELRGVVETEHGYWWVTIARPPFAPDERRFLYLLWQAALEWLLRVARTCRSRLPNQPTSIELRLLPVPETIEDAPQQIEFVPVDGIAVVTIVLPPTFIESLVTADNKGEEVLVTALVDAVIGMYRHTLSSQDRSAWLAELLADPALKMMHVTFNGDPGLAVDLVVDRMPLRLLQDTDLARAERGIYEELTELPASGVSIQTKHIKSQAGVRSALNCAVDLHWKRCQKLLNELDRMKTLILISRLIEAIHRDSVDSERGALARTRLYADSQEFELWAKRAMGKRDTVFNAYRIAAEMTLCEAPLNGGRDPGLSDTDTLAAEIQTLVQVAHYSDGVKYGLADPEIFIRPDGGIEFNNDLDKISLTDYTEASLGESIAKDIEAYPKLFDTTLATASESNVDETGFLTAFEKEFQLSLAEAAEIVHNLQALAVEMEVDVVALRRSTIEAKLSELSIDLDRETLTRFLQVFGLVPRPLWDEPSVPFRKDDVMPWFFERRLSLMMRPVLILSNESDPFLVYGVRQVSMGVLYASTLLEKGIWPKDKLQSLEAKEYIDQEVNRRGTLFEQEVAKIVEDAGWRSIPDISMRQLGASKKMGNLDVLAISHDGNTWIVIECKWFGAARTPREIANWLQDFRGNAGDKLDKHLQRFSWITAHAAEVMSTLGILIAPKQIIPRIVTTGPIPLAFTGSLPVGSDVWTRRELVTGLHGLK